MPLEDMFATFSVSDRLTILSALQDRAMMTKDDDEAQRAADLMVRLGYPSSAASALDVRASMAL